MVLMEYTNQELRCTGSVPSRSEKIDIEGNACAPRGTNGFEYSSDVGILQGNFLASNMTNGQRRKIVGCPENNVGLSACLTVYNEDGYVFLDTLTSVIASISEFRVSQ